MFFNVERESDQFSLNRTACERDVSVGVHFLPLGVVTGTKFSIKSPFCVTAFWSHVSVKSPFLV